MFVPLGTKDIPIELDKLAEQRTTFVEYEDGEKVTLSDLWRTSDDPTKVLKADKTWTGKTVFKLLAEQDGRRFSKKTNLRTTFNTELNLRYWNKHCQPLRQLANLMTPRLQLH